MERMSYADGTAIYRTRGPFAENVAADALCEDGKVRRVRLNRTPDTFFSHGGRVSVRGKTVSGFVSFETRDGFSTPTQDDPAIVRFTAYSYGKNANELPHKERAR